jgi:hypothetical protein
MLYQHSVIVFFFDPEAWGLGYTWTITKNLCCVQLVQLTVTKTYDDIKGYGLHSPGSLAISKF